MFGLPIAQFPNIVPPEIQVITSYVGADALTVEHSVATPIEQQMSGVDNMNYMYSINANNGLMRLTVDFDVKTDPEYRPDSHADARRRRPPRNCPLTCTILASRFRNPLSAPLLLFALYSPNGTYDAQFLANYAYINLIDPLTPRAGIAQCHDLRCGPIRDALLGEARPAWRNCKSPFRKSSTPSDPEHGQPSGTDRRRTGPARPRIHLRSPRPGTLDSEEEFGQIVVRANSRSAPSCGFSDVARIELGGQVYNLRAVYNGKPSAISPSINFPVPTPSPRPTARRN